MPPAFLDSSAIVVVLTEAAGFDDLRGRILNREGQRITSAISVYEAVTSIAGRNPTEEQMEMARSKVFAFLDEFGIEIVSCDAASIRAALDHYLDVVSRSEFVGESAPLVMGSSFAFAASKLANAEVIHVSNPLLE